MWKVQKSTDGDCASPRRASQSPKRRRNLWLRALLASGFALSATRLTQFPNHAKLTIGGQKKTVFDLRKRMNLEATIITDDTHTVMEQSKSVVGQAPFTPATPQQVGVLLILRPTPTPEVLASAEQPPATLPKTGTLLPLAGLLGALAVAISLGLGTFRRTIKA